MFAGVGMALTNFNPKTGAGILSKFSILDLRGEWFDENGFGPAEERDIESISIPEHLRPNLIAKPVQLSENDHLLAVMTYSEGKSISPAQVHKYFKSILGLSEIVDRFGVVEVDLFKDSEEIEALMNIETLKEVKVIIRRPNHIYDDLAKEIEDSLRQEHADELQRTIISRDDDFLTPGAPTRALGLLAAENGKVSIKYEDDGAIIRSDSDMKPLVKTVVTGDSEATTAGVFPKMCDFLFSSVRRNRQRIAEIQNDVNND